MTKLATFAAGCFWCTEAIFKDVSGVLRVTSGYTGGRVPNPTYEQVSTGTTGHAEGLQVEFDPSVVTFDQLCRIFFATHDPTTPNRQGNDVGEQYRSAIFYHDESQRDVAQRVMRDIASDGLYRQPMVTQLEKFSVFYPAEAYHQNYFENHPDQPYCRAVINPKLAKFRKSFAYLLKSSR